MVPKIGEACCTGKSPLVLIGMKSSL